MMLESLEEFNNKEKQQLAQYVTNTDKSIFALRNLPEVVKGALFSKYSRSKLGLRKLLLKEFIDSKENDFQGITGNKTNPENQEIAIKKAKDFYDRVLDGFGDDSIGELGGAHLAIENVSIVASKLIEDSRIGGSPLEKSTRYIFFDEKIGGEYRFLKEPVIMESKHKELYLKTCNLLFDTYKELIVPLNTYVKKIQPQEKGLSDIVYKNIIRARVCDALRGLLPASTLTNLGLFGNGRFFENLIQKFHISSLKELNAIGEISLKELEKVIPSFVRKASCEHRHFKSWSKFLHEQTRHIKSSTEKILKSKDIKFIEKSVDLIEYDQHAAQTIAATMLFEHSKIPLKELNTIMSTLDDNEIKTILASSYEFRTNRRHKPPRALEHVFFTFDLLGDFGMFRDLHRHRILTQERQLLSTNNGFYLPKDIIDAGLQNTFTNALNKAKEAYEIIASDFPVEAQYIVPIAYNIRWYFKINLRSLIWMLELRTIPQGHASYRTMAQKMAKLVMDKEPLLAPFFKFVDFNNYELGRLEQEKKSEKI